MVIVVHCKRSSKRVHINAVEIVISVSGRYCTGESIQTQFSKNTVKFIVKMI